MADQPDHLSDDDVSVQEAKPALKQPPLYNVILLNDDYTPMEFVVHVIQYFFGLPREQSVRIMLHVHTRGKGVCGCYSREIAEAKVTQVNEYSREHRHPLLCAMERA